MREPTSGEAAASPDPTALAAAGTQVPEAQGSSAIRPTPEFPADPSPLSRDHLEERYRAMRRSHASLSRSRGQLLRRSREFSLTRQRFLDTLRGYEDRLAAIGREKAEAMEIAQDLHRELATFEGKQQALDRILTELDEAREEAGFWSTFTITRLIAALRRVLRGERTGSDDPGRSDG